MRLWLWRRAHETVNRLAHRFSPLPLHTEPIGEREAEAIAARVKASSWLWRLSDWLAARWVPAYVAARVAEARRTLD